MLALTSIWTTILLAAAVALAPMAIDMYLPALPQIGADFSAGTDQVQLTLSVYLIGFAIAQLVCGPLADRFGRKRSEEHTSELQSRPHLVCRLLLEKKYYTRTSHCPISN